MTDGSQSGPPVEIICQLRFYLCPAPKGGHYNACTAGAVLATGKRLVSGVVDRSSFEDARAQIELLLAHPHSPVGAGRQQAFDAFQLKHYWRFLLLVNVLAHFAFLSYGVADALVLPELASTSIVVRVGYMAVVAPIALVLFKRCRSAQVLDLVLPLSVLPATFIWFELLTLTTEPSVRIYLYASLIFIVLANLCVQVRFLPALVVSFLIAAVTLQGVYRLNAGDPHGVLVFVLVYLPVFMFSIFISWSTTLDRRRTFLRALLDEMTHEELSQANQLLQTMANTDALTGVGNRRWFEDQGQREIDRAFRQNEPLCLLIFDVDHFKRINDTYGHDAGDEVLRAMSSEVKGQLRGIDLLARFGGEEFIVMLPSTRLDEARQVAERLRLHLQQCEVPTRMGHLVRFTVSVGICELGSAAHDLHGLLTEADLALYRAKKAGRNHVCVAGA